MTPEHPQCLETADTELALLGRVWRSVIGSLTAMFPQALISARLRPDVYHTGNGVIARDSAGVRVIVAGYAALDEGVRCVLGRWPQAEVRDYREGHPRADYYRGVHIFVTHDSYEVEVQLRTERQHRIAAWTHAHLLPPLLPEDEQLAADSSVGEFLSALSECYDQRDRGMIIATVPELPSVLQSHAAELVLRCIRPECD